MGADLGGRLREVRKRRGLTQRQLAVEAGVSLSTVRKLEQGERDGPRLETLRRLAVALRVPTTSLIAQAHTTTAEPPYEQWASLRRALLAPVPAAGHDEPPTVSGTLAILDTVAALAAADRFEDLSVILPSLLHDGDQLAGIGPEGRAVRARVLRLTGWLLTQTRQFDTAEIALERALAGAPDRLQAASTISTMCWLQLRQGRMSQARDLATRWADDIEPRVSRATPAELSAWGWLLLRLSAAAVRDNRDDEAEDSLRYASAAAAALSGDYAPGTDFLRTFGPVTVALKRAENAMILDRPDLVLRLSEHIPLEGLRTTSNNRNRHLLDVADAHAHQRQYAEAVAILTGIQHAAPQWLPHQRYARDILTRVIARRRTLTPEMRSLAAAVGLPL